jgi:general stress protein 26
MAHSLQDIIDQTFESANQHTKKIFGKPMKADEVIELVNTGKPFTSGFTATVNKNGTPHMSWDLYAIFQNKLYLCSSSKSRTFRNLVRTKHIAVTIPNSKGSSAVFLEGVASLIGTVGNLKVDLISKIEKSVEGFQIPDPEAPIFEISLEKVYTYRQFTSESSMLTSGLDNCRE